MKTNLILKIIGYCCMALGHAIITHGKSASFWVAGDILMTAGGLLLAGRALQKLKQENNKEL